MSGFVQDDRDDYTAFVGCAGFVKEVGGGPRGIGTRGEVYIAIVIPIWPQVRIGDPEIVGLVEAADVRA